MNNELKYMNLKEFIEGGFLQEANRLFFHPRGLALQIKAYEDHTSMYEVQYKLSGIEDYRDDPEGIYFGATEDLEINAKRKAKIDNVEKTLDEQNRKRNSIVGLTVHNIIVEDIWTDNTEFTK